MIKSVDTKNNKSFLQKFEEKWCPDIDSGFISPLCHIDDISDLVYDTTEYAIEYVLEEIKKNKKITAESLMEKIRIY